MAYVLGFFIADGYVITNKRGSQYLNFCSTDRELIEQIRTSLASTHKIGMRKRKGRNSHWKPGYYLQIGSKKSVNDLQRYGIVQNKSKTVEFPDVPPEFLGDFVRGYFDGDGCVIYRKRFRIDRSRWFNELRVIFTSGSKAFLEGLSGALQPHVRKSKVNSESASNTHRLAYANRDSLALFRLMYHTRSVGIRLGRKFDIFSEAYSELGP